MSRNFHGQLSSSLWWENLVFFKVVPFNSKPGHSYIFKDTYSVCFCMLKNYVILCWQVKSYCVRYECFYWQGKHGEIKISAACSAKDTWLRHLNTKTEQARIIGFKRSFTLTPWARHGKKDQKTTISKKKITQQDIYTTSVGRKRWQ